ncbi:MAG: helix-turn-helix transcriptional regulator [Flavitalea sp.]
MSEQNSGGIIKTARLNMGFSQQELADKTALSLRTIQRIENGETIPRGDSLQRIAAVLGVEVKLLIPDTSQDVVNDEISSVSKDTGSLKNDRGLIFLLKISPLAYLIFPLLALVTPFVLGKIFEDKIAGVKAKAKLILIQQSIWLLMLGLAHAYVFQKKIFGTNLPMPNNEYSLIVLTAGLYYFNALFIVGSGLKWLITDSKSLSLASPSNS